MSKNMVLPRILHILDYEKQGVCAYIPLFGGGIEDFVIMFWKYYWEVLRHTNRLF